MRLQVMSCTAVVLDQEAVHVTVEDPTGSLGIRPGHAPLVTPLVQGIVHVRTQTGSTTYVAVNGGVMVVTPDQVRIASRQAVAGSDLRHLETTVLQQFEAEAEADRTNHTAFEKMRLSFLRRVTDFERSGGKV